MDFLLYTDYPDLNKAIAAQYVVTFLQHYEKMCTSDQH